MIERAQGKSSIKRFAVVALLLLLTATVLFSRSGNPAPGTALSATTTQPARAQGSFVSGGMGLSRDAWDGKFGTPSQDTAPAIKHYQNGNYVVTFWGDNPAYVMSILRPSSPASSISNQQALDEAHSMLPSDATLVQRATRTERGPTSTIYDSLEFYNSPGLATRFPPWHGSAFDWSGSTPGDIVIIYKLDQNGHLLLWQMDAGAGI